MERCVDEECEKNPRFLCFCNESLRFCSLHVLGHLDEPGFHSELLMAEAAKEINMKSREEVEKLRGKESEVRKQSKAMIDMIYKRIKDIMESIHFRQTELIKLGNSKEFSSEVLGKIEKLGDVKALFNEHNQVQKEIEEYFGCEIDGEKELIQNVLKGVYEKIQETNEILRSFSPEKIESAERKLVKLEEKIKKSKEKSKKLKLKISDIENTSQKQSNDLAVLKSVLQDFNFNYNFQLHMIKEENEKIMKIIETKCNTHEENLKLFGHKNEEKSPAKQLIKEKSIIKPPLENKPFEFPDYEDLMKRVLILQQDLHLIKENSSTISEHLLRKEQKKAISNYKLLTEMQNSFNNLCSQTNTYLTDFTFSSIFSPSILDAILSTSIEFLPKANEIESEFLINYCLIKESMQFISETIENFENIIFFESDFLEFAKANLKISNSILPQFKENENFCNSFQEFIKNIHLHQAKTFHVSISKSRKFYFLCIFYSDFNTENDLFKDLNPGGHFFYSIFYIVIIWDVLGKFIKLSSSIKKTNWKRWLQTYPECNYLNFHA